MKTQMGGQPDNLQVFARDGLFRVQAGPYASQPEARQAAERMNQSLGLKPMVLSR
jgi:rare lipoprotein A